MSPRYFLLLCLIVVSGVLGPSAVQAASAQQTTPEGCQWRCPACPPGQVCTMGGCELICPPEVQACGSRACPRGEVCCNESCGVCTAPGEACTQQYCSSPVRGHECSSRASCAEGYHWSETQCRCLPDSTATTGCNTDADCVAYSDYCDGRSCVALSTSDPRPTCESGNYVQCFTDPCEGKKAVCNTSTRTCQLVSSSTD